jgi:mono/diheme cytochrome c family protein
VVVLGAWIGFLNVGASSGHWKITDWFLHFAMRSSVRTYALAVDVPAELPREAAQPAAGHFARGCAICHGAPGEPRSPAALRMLPQPPDLADVVGEWNNAQLFRIVKHGVRFTGMPAWPMQDRDDEVWAMVAFLRELS